MAPMNLLAAKPAAPGTPAKTAKPAETSKPAAKPDAPSEPRGQYGATSAVPSERIRHFSL